MKPELTWSNLEDYFKYCILLYPEIAWDNGSLFYSPERHFIKSILLHRGE